jgi:hypothetical protein
VDTFSTPLVECFRQGEAPRDVRLLAARGGLALRPEAQLSLLMLLVSDEDPEVAAVARTTVARLPPEPLAALLAGSDVPDEVRAFFAGVGRDTASSPPPAGGAPTDEAALAAVLVEPPRDPEPAEATSAEAPDGQETPERRGAAQRLAMLSVSERMKVATQGNREERSILVRDPNRLVSAAVLSSPKLTESEIEAIARMTNVSSEVLRTVGTSRVWLKNYAVASALTRNAKTPIPIALTLLNRMTERDIKFLANDRNIPEPVRLAARKIYAHQVSRRQ